MANTLTRAKGLGARGEEKLRAARFPTPPVNGDVTESNGEEKPLAACPSPLASLSSPFAPPSSPPEGRVLAIRGPVVDVGFDGKLPSLHEVLRVVHGDRDLLLEVQQILAGRIVRTIALGHTEGLSRDATVVRTGRCVHVPVGPATLGRVLNALGEPLDGDAPPAVDVQWPIHRTLVPLATERNPLAFLETGIKVIDLLAPIGRRGTAGIIGGAGLGKTILLHELMRVLTQKQGRVVVFSGVGERTREGNDLWLEMRENGALANAVMVLAQMSEPPGARFRAALAALTMAEFFRDEQDREVIFLIDSLSRHLQAGFEVSGLLGRLPSEMGYQPTLASDLGILEARIAATAWVGITSVQAVYVPADDLTDPAVAQAFVHFDSSIVLARDRASRGFYPAVDLLASNSRLLDPALVGDRHYQIAMRVKQTIKRHRTLEDIIAMMGLAELQPEDREAVCRSRLLERFLTQPLFSTESFTGQAGCHVPLEQTLDGCEAILNGKFDGAPVRQLYMIGAAPQ